MERKSGGEFKEILGGIIVGRAITIHKGFNKETMPWKIYKTDENRKQRSY